LLLEGEKALRIPHDSSRTAIPNAIPSVHFFNTESIWLILNMAKGPIEDISNGLVLLTRSDR
jgi:hypothetical protein